jgi:hypothetical protein
MPARTSEQGPHTEQAPLALNRGEVIGAVSALLLLVLMFALAWYGVNGIPGGSRTDIASSENAWQGLTLVRWLMLLMAAVAFGAVAIHFSRASRTAIAATRLALLVVATLTAAMVVVRVLIDLPSPERVVDQKLGAVLGVLATLGVALGAYEAVREQRARILALGRRPKPEERVASGHAAR